MVVFDSTKIYLQSATTIDDRIAKLEAIIDSLLLAAADSANNSDVTEYWLDDGQTKIKEVFRGPSAILASIKVYEQLLNYYINKKNGHVMRRVDARSFPYTR